MAYVYHSQLDAFTLYHVAHEASAHKNVVGPVLPALGHATSGAAGTAVSKLITYPLDLIITRLQVQKHSQSDDQDANYHGILDAVEKIYKNEGGLQAFYSGVLPETFKGVIDSFLFFLAYTYVGQKRRRAQGSRTLSALEEVGVGTVAGAFSKFWTSPIQNIVTRKQTAALVASRESMSSLSPALSLKEIALQIQQEKGLHGFWSGYSASLILTLNPSITFLLHKVLLRLLVPRARRSNPGAKLTFLLAAVSKALAATIMYPFSLMKTRAQISSQAPSQRIGPTSETQKAEDTSRARAAKTQPRTVFSTMLHLARAEGIPALYQGLEAEVLKGFFSHGITMLVKDRIHTLIINLYYLILRSLKKYPGPEELAKLASKHAKDAYEQATGIEAPDTAMSKVQEAAENR